MTHRTSSDFWRCFDALPAAAQRLARKQFALLASTPSHRSLQLKELRPGLMSARVSRSYRVLGWREDDAILWFWIGTHAEYDQSIR